MCTGREIKDQIIFFFILPKTPANETPDAHLFQQWYLQ